MDEQLCKCGEPRVPGYGTCGDFGCRIGYVSVSCGNCSQANQCEKCKESTRLANGGYELTGDSDLG